MRGGLSGGHADARSRSVADGRQVRCGSHRPGHRLPRHPGGAVGRTQPAVSLHEEAASVPAHTDRDEGRRPGAAERPAGQAAHWRERERGDATDHGGTHGAGGRAPARGPARRAVRPTQVRVASDRQPQEDGEEGAEVEGRMTQVTVLGAGSWGTAFSLVLADAGNDVTLWARREEVCDTINRRRENTDYLPGVELPPTVLATHDTEKA